MKRPRSPSESPKSRNPVDSSENRDADQHLDKQIIKPLNVKFGLDKASKCCDVFNRLLPFIEACLPDSEAWQNGRAFTETVQEIKDIMESAKMKVNLKREQLEKLTEALTDSTFGGANVYALDDLMSLAVEELIVAMRRMDVQDSDSFARQVFDIIPKSMPEWAKLEKKKKSTALRARRRVIEYPYKVLVVIRKLVELGLPVNAFQALVQLISLYNIEDPRGVMWTHIDHQGLLDETIRRLVLTGEAPRIYIPRDLDVRKSYRTIMSHGRELVTPEAVIIPTIPTYWNFAAAARVLRTSYFKPTCLNIGLSYKYCFHFHCYSLLDWLQKKAWSELRASTFQTIGTVLPAELTETMFEHVLAAEGIPIDPGVENLLLVPLPHSQGDQRPPPHCERLKDEYRCIVLQKKIAGIPHYLRQFSDNQVGSTPVGFAQPDSIAF